MSAKIFSQEEVQWLATHDGIGVAEKRKVLAAVSARHLVETDRKDRRIAELERALKELRDTVIAHYDLTDEDFDPALVHNFNATFRPVIDALVSSAALTGQGAQGGGGAK